MEEVEGEEEAEVEARCSCATWVSTASSEMLGTARTSIGGPSVLVHAREK